MTVKKSEPHKDSKLIQERRQEMVGRLMVRGFTSREIAEALATPGKDGRIPILNPDTMLPYTEETIRLDQKAIQKKWAASTKKSVEKHRAQQMAELTEVKRNAWKADNYAVVLSALAHEAKLTDTAAPLRINVSLVVDWWEAIERRGHDPETVIKAMIAAMAAQS